AMGGVLNAGDTVTVTVTMDEATLVDTKDGTPRIALDIGGSTVYADYDSGSGSTQLLFTYTIQAGQTDANGIAIAADALDANGGSLADAAGNTGVLTHAAVADNASYAVDTTAPQARVVLSSMVMLEPDGMTTGYDYAPQITALGSDGAFAVTWYGYDGNDYSIFVQRFDNAGAPVGIPILLEPDGVTTAQDYDPQITALGNDGAFAVTWYGNDGSDYSIFVQRFDNAGAPVGIPTLLEPDAVTMHDDLPI